jgi:asparagine synthase (glutamine-hydrolysing)
MCGIAGVVKARSSKDELTAIAGAMSEPLRHRGPDDSGIFIAPSGSAALAFRRLAIIDLSPAGHQPMTSASGRYTIIFNGEVYNFERLRDELVREGVAPRWRGHSDTEVILAAFEAWGVGAAVPRFNGMFAMAVWDERERTLRLVRDRMGVKPMYYAKCGDTFLFGSELKALTTYDALPRNVSRGALALYMRYAYVPAPHTIYEGVFKQTPGTILTVSSDLSRVEETPFWSVCDAATRGVKDRFTGGDDEAIEELQRIALDAIGLRMIADVPLGVFLSGGIDSSFVTALMQAQSSMPVKTFSIGFSEAEYDEARYAKLVARHLGTDHTEMIVTPEDALAVIPSLPSMYDEPFADSSQIPTHLLSRLARQHVTVSLSGDGGDELFGGYHRYFLGRQLWERAQRLPRPARAVASRAMRAVPMSAWNKLLSPRRKYVPARLRRDRAGERIHKLAHAMDAQNPDYLYYEVVSQWTDVVLGAEELPIAITRRDDWPSLDDFVERMMFADQVSYLPDDILTKVDRASMAVSLESREPLLDHRLVEFAWRLPLSMKLRDGKGKWILRRLLSRYVPESMFERPKMGFGVPIDHWLRGPLRDWAESLLDERRLINDAFFRTDAIRNKWKEHLNGSGEWQHYLWTVLMFQAWHDQERGRDSAACVSDRLPAAAAPVLSAR